MSKCLTCGADVPRTEGKRERKFCDNKNKCKQLYYSKNKPPKFVKVPIEEWEKLTNLVQLEALKTGNEFPTKKDFELQPHFNPTIPVRMKGEDALVFAERKNEWKRLYGK